MLSFNPVNNCTISPDPLYLRFVSNNHLLYVFSLDVIVHITTCFTWVFFSTNKYSFYILYKIYSLDNFKGKQLVCLEVSTVLSIHFKIKI